MRPDYVPAGPPPAAPARVRRCRPRRRCRRHPSTPLAAEAPPPARDGVDQPGGRPARHDGAPRRWLMSIGCRRRATVYLVMVAVLAALSGCELARAELAAAARHPGPRPGLLRDQGAAARCQQPSTEFAGAGRRRDGRHRHQDRTPGLACAADDEPQRRRRSARQRDRQARPDQPARFAARRAGPTDRRRHRRASCTTGR